MSAPLTKLNGYIEWNSLLEWAIDHSLGGLLKSPGHLDAKLDPVERVPLKPLRTSQIWMAMKKSKK